VKRAIFILFVACLAVGFAFVGLVGGRPDARPEPAAISALAVSSPGAPAGDVGGMLSLEAGTIEHPIPYERYMDESFAQRAAPAVIEL